MPLYRIGPNNRSLSQVARKEFANEDELHILVEEILQELLGIRLIAREGTSHWGQVLNCEKQRCSA